MVDLAVMKLLPMKLMIPGLRAKPGGGHGHMTDHMTGQAQSYYEGG